MSRRAREAVVSSFAAPGTGVQDDRAVRTLRAGVVLAIALVCVQSVAHLVNVRFFDLAVDAINADSDTSVFAWASSLATAACGLLLLALVRCERRPLPVAALAAAVVFLAIDDLAGIHERVSEHQTEIAGIDHASRLFWPLVYMPLLAGVFIGLWVLASRMRPLSGLILKVALGCLATAIAMEMASPLLFELGFGHGSAPYELEATAEEGLELGGWLLAGTAIAATLVERGGRGRSRSAREVPLPRAAGYED